ncbi:MAG: ribosome-associated translation inhibitor RaiA [Actinobacteria bacterium]|nr:ribosome-associated translation inhibitor RaiA [Actinomycetota bacterium]
MQISVSGRHLHLSPHVQDYARTKAAKLSQFFNKIQTVDVVISKQGLDYAVEIIVKPDHRESFIGRGSGSDVQACIDLSLDKLERQITRYKEKIRNRKHKTGLAEGLAPPELL